MPWRGDQEPGGGLSELEAAKVGVVAEVKRKPLDLARSGPYFVGLLLMAVVAFWPSYLT